MVLSQDEIRRLLLAIPKGFIACAISLWQRAAVDGGGALAVQDIDFNYGCLRIWNGKGGKHRQVTLAPQLHDGLKQQIKLMSVYLQQDLANPLFAGVWLPDALARKYPNAPKELGWQYLFGAARLSRDPMAAGEVWRRHHIDESGLQKAVRFAATQCQFNKPVGCHTLRHSLPPICWPVGRIFARCRSSWGIAMWPPRRFIPMCCGRGPVGLEPIGVAVI